MIIYESKDGRIRAVQIKTKVYSLQVKETNGIYYYEGIVNYQNLSFADAEKKIRALGIKAKKLMDDTAIQIFLANLK